MNHIEFVEQQVRAELIRQGFSQTVAQGGGMAGSGFIQTHVTGNTQREDFR